MAKSMEAASCRQGTASQCLRLACAQVRTRAQQMLARTARGVSRNRGAHTAPT